MKTRHGRQVPLHGVMWFIALALAAGCAGAKLAPPAEDQKARTMQVPEGKALVYVMLPIRMDPGRTIWVNYQPVGKLGGKSYLVLEVEPGSLVIHMLAGTVVVAREVRAEVGRRYYLRFRQETSVSPWTALTMLAGVVLTKHKLSIDVVQEADGPEALTCCGLTKVVVVQAPTEKERQAKVRSAGPDTALIYLYRSTWTEWDKRYAVQVNGQAVGEIGAQSFLVIEVAPGRHRLEMLESSDQAAATALDVDAAAGSRHYVRADPDGKVELRAMDVQDWALAMERLRLAGPGTVSIQERLRSLKPLDSSRVSAVGERWKRAEVKEFVILSYNQILADLGKGEGNYLESLLQMLEIESEQRDEAIDNIRKLSEVYTVIPEFADRTIDLYAKAAVEPKPTPAAAPVAVTARPTAVQAPPGMVRIKAGTFQMGNEEVSTDAVHAVSLQSFYLDHTEVTQQDFQNVMKFNPSRDKAPNNPVEKATWFQAQEYCKKVGKRLPTEAEWEYAARAGTTTKYSFGKYSSLLKNYGNYCGTDCASGPGAYQALDEDDNLEIAPVKKYKPNPWGIHDMHGNVAEWVNDWYGGFQGLSENNPTGPESGNEKVVRGGSWKSSASETASASRDKINPSTSYDTIGFRCAADAQ